MTVIDKLRYLISELMLLVSLILVAVVNSYSFL